MSTARDIITRANRAANLIATGDPLSDDDAVAGLAILNEMLHEFDIDAIPIGHNTLGLDDTVLLEDSYISSVVYCLAVRIAPESGREAPASIQRLAMQGRRRLQSAAFQYEDDLKTDRGLRRMPNSYHGYRRTDGYNIEES